jgi:alpha-L-fucosidase
MRLPRLWILLLAAACAGSAATPEWFAQARFGIHLPAGADAGVWMPRVARAGARYVVTETPDEASAELARKSGLLLLDRAGYANLGQIVPPGPVPHKDLSATWEARFAMTEESGGATSRELIRLLIEAASKGGNLLLSLPPKAEDGGRALAEIGDWLRANGESIFDTTPSPFDRMPFFGRATAKGNVLYLHLFQWPSNGKLPVAGLQTEVVSAELLATGATLRFTGTTVELPAAAPAVAANVLKLTLKGPAKVQPYVLSPDQDGYITARPESCEFQTKPGMIVRRENRNDRVYLSHWTRAIDVPTWKVFVPRDGRYQVEVVYSAAEVSRNVLFTITMKGPTMGMVKGTVEPTAGASRRVKVSNMELEAGNHLLYVQPENKAGQPAMELEAVILHRIGD